MSYLIRLKNSQDIARCQAAVLMAERGGVPAPPPRCADCQAPPDRCLPPMNFPPRSLEPAEGFPRLDLGTRPVAESRARVLKGSLPDASPVAEGCQGEAASAGQAGGGFCHFRHSWATGTRPERVGALRPKLFQNRRAYTPTEDFRNMGVQKAAAPTSSRRGRNWENHADWPGPIGYLQYFLYRSLMRPQWRPARKLSMYLARAGPSLW